MNYFKFTYIAVGEFPKVLRKSFVYQWDTTYGHKPGYQSWDDSKEVPKMFLPKEDGTTDVPTHLSYTVWYFLSIIWVPIYSQSFSEEEIEGRKTSLSEKYVKPHRLAEDDLPISIRKTHNSVTEDYFAREEARKIEEDIRNDEFKFPKEKELGSSKRLKKTWDTKFRRMEKTEELLERIMETSREREKVPHELKKLIKSSKRFLINGKAYDWQQHHYCFPFSVSLVLKIPTRLSVSRGDRFLSVIGF